MACYIIWIYTCIIFFILWVILYHKCHINSGVIFLIDITMKHKRIDTILKRITTDGDVNMDSTSSPLQRHDSNDPIVQLEKFVWLRICWEKHVVCKESSHSNLLAKNFICGWKEKEKLTCHFYKPGNSQEVHLIMAIGIVTYQWKLDSVS